MYTTHNVPDILFGTQPEYIPSNIDAIETVHVLQLNNQVTLCLELSSAKHALSLLTELEAITQGDTISEADYYTKHIDQSEFSGDYYIDLPEARWAYDQTTNALTLKYKVICEKYTDLPNEHQLRIMREPRYMVEHKEAM